MFCPKCRTEYRPGFAVCADCRIDLVEFISPETEPEPEWLDLREIAVIDNPAEMAFISSILEEQGISYYFKSGSLMNASMLADPAKLLVPPDQIDTARNILAEALRSFEDDGEADMETDELACLNCGNSIAEDESECPQCGWSWDQGNPM